LGIGDSIMATAWARKAKQENPDSYVFLGNGKVCEWDDVFENNPNISHPKWVAKAVGEHKAIFVPHHTGNRPYVSYLDGVSVEWNREHRAIPGDIFLTEKERQWANDECGKGYILIEPHIKGTFGGNKAWIWDRWVELVERLKDQDVAQNYPRAKKALPGARTLNTTSIRKLLASVANARLVITTDGVLHHAAAALGVPAVVIWGARIPPDILGYQDHENIYTGNGEYCGLCVPCKHCSEGMKRVTVDMVEEAVRRILAKH